jgi:hypothetical protein
LGDEGREAKAVVAMQPSASQGAVASARKAAPARGRQPRALRPAVGVAVAAGGDAHWQEF